MIELPMGWTEARVSDVCDEVAKVDPRLEPETVITYIDISGVDGERGLISTTQELNGRDAPSRARQLVASGDVVVSTVRTYMRKSALVPAELDGAVGSTGFSVLRPTSAIDPRLLFHAVRHPGFVERLSSQQVGSSYPAVRDRDVREMPLVLPPLAEQGRIVAAIDEAFSKLDVGEVGLRHIRQLLKRMREAVLTAAIAGRLVPQDPADTPASGWQEWTSAKEDPFALDTLPDLPEPWSWVRAASACEAVECGGTPAAPHMTQGIGDVPFIKVYNLTMRGALDFSVNPTFIDTATHTKQSRSAARPGDVLTNIVGPPLGKVAVVPSTFPSWNMNQAVVMFRPGPGLLSDYLAIALQTTAVLGRLAATARATAGQFNVSLTACRYLPIPIPPESEQQRIVDEVHRQLSFVVACERTVEFGLARSDGLRRSVLKAAFDGRLVPQNSSEEPASVLLERIRSKRASGGTPSGGRRRKKVEAL
jgi:type I restriction enzyme S subunit